VNDLARGRASRPSAFFFRISAKDAKHAKIAKEEEKTAQEM
jgi:hypothetical protein